jgi:hypothetical protein
MQHSGQRWFRAVIVVAVAAVTVIAARQYPQSRQSLHYNLEYDESIDGQKHPELIPEYLAWESGFHMLASVSRSPSSGMPGNVGLLCRTRT